MVKWVPHMFVRSKVCPSTATLLYDGKKIEIVYVIAMLTNTYVHVNIEESLNQALVKISLHGK